MKNLKIVLFEDLLSFHFYPLSSTRPVFDLDIGCLSLYEKTRIRYPDLQIKLICRKEMRDIVKESGRELFNDEDFKNAEDYVFINARASFSKSHKFFKDTCMFEGNDLVYIHPGKNRMADWRIIDFLDGEYITKARSLGLQDKQIENRLYRYPWDMIQNNGKEIEEDLILLKNVKNEGKISNKAQIIGSGTFIAAEGSEVYPGVYIDTSQGSVFIDRGARIMPMSFIQGPAYIGADTVIDSAKIRPDTSIGNTCKISGEIESSIIMDFTNKHHDGFLGHAYLGSWVNIGAMAANSDLKNNYNGISVFQEGRKINTGCRKMGCLIGDHSKIGIGVMINTGCVIGSGSNIYNQGLLITGEVPPFAWGGKKPFSEYSMNKFLDMVIHVMERRKQKLSESMRKRLMMLFAETREFREKFIF